MAIGKSSSLPKIPPDRSLVFITSDRARGQWIRTTMEDFAANLSLHTGTPLSDGTGLKGKYDLALHWAPEQIGNVAFPGQIVESGVPAAPEPSGPSLFTALQEQLGLKLQPRKVTVEILVIDHIEKTPTEN